MKDGSSGAAHDCRQPHPVRVADTLNVKKPAMKRKSIWQLLKDTVVQWMEDQPFQIAAALSYYTLFSLAPLLIIAISIAGLAFGHEAAQNQIVETLQDLVGRDSAQAIQEIVQNASSKPESESFRVSWEFSFVGRRRRCRWPTPNLSKYDLGCGAEGWSRHWGFVRQRFISFAMVLAIGFFSWSRLRKRAVDDIHAIHESCSARQRFSPTPSILSFHLFCYSAFCDDL